jgi:uncharacterized SAM-binding protein YcdF (DUF218 family)
MNIKWKKYWGFYCILLIILSFVLLVLVSIPVKIAIARFQQPIPQAILTLGGDTQREVFTAQFAKTHQYLPIWISTGSVPNVGRKIFQDAGILETQFHLDRRATDTVTNFTTLVEDFKKQHIKHLFLITSDFHLPRAKAIAFLVLGSQGIAFTPVSIPTDQQPESKLKIARDITRAFIWIFTKHTGSSLDNHRII